MLLRAATPVAERVPGLAPALARLAGDLGAGDAEELSVRLCLHPGIALDLALVPLHLRALGLGGQQLEPLLADLFGSDRIRGPERQANRELEQLWLHGLWSGEVEPGGVARALAASSLAWEFDHLAGTTDDAYAFTHAILYATDHGRHRVVLPRPVEEIVSDAEAILAVALDAGNHDVAAEILWTWPMLRQPWTPLAAEARDFLADVSESYGFLPGPGFDRDAYEGLPGSGRELYLLRTSYHTTLVHGLVLAATMSLDAGPGAMDPVPRVADRVMVLLPPPANSLAWWSWFAQLTAAGRDQLAPALVTMALRRAVTAADLAAVHRTLSVADECGLPDSPATRQARLLLRRAIACAELATAGSRG
jgi:hypothetical protein